MLPQADARSLLAQPQILRFANDEFMEELLATLELAPAALPNFTAQPETWREPHAGPVPAPQNWVQREPARLLPLLRRAKAQGAAAGGGNGRDAAGAAAEALPARAPAPLLGGGLAGVPGGRACPTRPSTPHASAWPS